MKILEYVHIQGEFTFKSTGFQGTFHRLFKEQSNHPCHLEPKGKGYVASFYDKSLHSSEIVRGHKKNGWIKSLGVILARTDWVGTDSFDVINLVSEWMEYGWLRP